MKKLFLLLAIATSASFAEPVYKCTSDSGKVLYSNEPCVGAERIDATASRGFNKSSGRVLKGSDVRNEEYNETMERAMQQVFGKSYQRQKRVQRSKLSTTDQARCEKLDYDIEGLEKLEKASKGKPELRDVQVELFQKRKAFREIDC